MEVVMGCNGPSHERHVNGAGAAVTPGGVGEAWWGRGQHLLPYLATQGYCIATVRIPHSPNMNPRQRQARPTGRIDTTAAGCPLFSTLFLSAQSPCGLTDRPEPPGPRVSPLDVCP